jgi:hypothetical protein
VSSLILSVLLALYLLQALLKFGVHFFVRYETRRKRIDALYQGRQMALYDDVVLGLMLVFLAFLFASGRMEHLSLITGLVVGTTLIQTYFHRFSAPVSADKAPEGAVTPIKLMSYAIQAEPRRAWREYLFMTVLFVWALYALVRQAPGLLG